MDARTAVWASTAKRIFKVVLGSGFRKGVAGMVSPPIFFRFPPFFFLRFLPFFCPLPLFSSFFCCFSQVPIFFRFSCPFSSLFFRFLPFFHCQKKKKKRETPFARPLLRNPDGRNSNFLESASLCRRTHVSAVCSGEHEPRTVVCQDLFDHDKGQKSAILGRRLHWMFSNFLQWIFFSFLRYSEKSARP